VCPLFAISRLFVEDVYWQIAIIGFIEGGQPKRRCHTCHKSAFVTILPPYRIPLSEQQTTITITTTTMKFLAFALSTLFSATVLARPNGAPNCPVDGPAPSAGHLRPGNTNGSLEFGGVTVAINGCELEVGVPFEIEVFETVTVTISRDSYYRGVLARFDIDQAIGLVEDETDLKISIPCSDNDESLLHTQLLACVYCIETQSSS
jgi:hypothetical protein